MAPSPRPTTSAIHERQTNLPVCVSTCLASANFGGCSPLDYSCICRSATYQNSVATCWAGKCTAAEIAIGQQFSAQACLAVSVTLGAPAASSGIVSGASSIASGTASSGRSSSPASATSVAVSGTPANWLEPPLVFRNEVIKVQAIMSSLCGLILIGAIVLGVFSCRARVKRDREQTQGTWTGVGTGTFGRDTKHSSRFGGISSRGMTSTSGARTQTDTLMSDTFAHTASQTTSFGQAAPMYGDRPRFTNRMTVDESEEWELKDRIPSASGSGGGGSEEDLKEVEVESPTSAVSGMADEVDFNSSRVGLTQVNVLDKTPRAY